MPPPKKQKPSGGGEGRWYLLENHREDCFHEFTLDHFAATAQ